MTRVYIPTSLTGLAAAQAAGVLGGEEPELVAHAVTPAVREWYVEGDLEELEFSALIDAAEASLAVLARQPQAARRRVVVAADVPEGTVEPGNDADSRSAVRIKAPVPLSSVVSIHVDEPGPEAESVVAAAVDAVDAAAAGDDDARFLLDEAEGLDLLWYDVTEIDDLIGTT